MREAGPKRVISRGGEGEVLLERNIWCKSLCVCNIFFTLFSLIPLAPTNSQDLLCSAQPAWQVCSALRRPKLASILVIMPLPPDSLHLAKALHDRDRSPFWVLVGRTQPKLLSFQATSHFFWLSGANSAVTWCWIRTLNEKGEGQLIHRNRNSHIFFHDGWSKAPLGKEQPLNF